MKTKDSTSKDSLTLVCLWLLVVSLTTPQAMAALVLPQMGGGSVSQENAPMKHADIIFINSAAPLLAVGIDHSINTPKLRELSIPDEFDLSEPWSVLAGKAYNYQYGWNPAGFINLPSNTSIWIEQTDASPELEVYDRSPNTLSYDPIFGTDGSSLRWRWTGFMTHNAYAVANPSSSNYYANYKVYLGNTQTGDPLAGYNSTDVTFEFQFDLPLAGDFNQDGVVTEADYSTWVDQYGLNGADLSADGNHDQLVDAADYSLWRDAMTGLSSGLATAIPEPTTLLMTCHIAILIFTSKYRCRF